MKKSNKKGFKEIIKLFNKSIEINTEFCDNYYNKAIIFFNNKENQNALTDIQIVIEKYDKTKKIPWKIMTFRIFIIYKD